MEGLTLAIGSSASEDPNRFKFGGEKEYAYAFDFEPPSATATPWPGPPYDEKARFAPGVFDKARSSRQRAKHRSSKRKLAQQEHGRSSPRLARQAQEKVGTDIGRSKAFSRPIQYYGSPPPRDIPLHLLSLPGEIRNHIHRVLAVSQEPLVAQFKPIISPKKGLKNPHRRKLRRFPREPVLALANQQLRKELLSIFYGANKFLIRQTEHQDLKSHSLFFSEELKSWAPKADLAACLTHMEVQFTARLLVGGKQTINYVIRNSKFSVGCRRSACSPHKIHRCCLFSRPALSIGCCLRLKNGLTLYPTKPVGDRGLTITSDTEIDQYCTCFDKRFLEYIKAEKDAERLKGPEVSFAQHVVDLIRERKGRLMLDMGLVQNGSRFRPKVSCSDIPSIISECC
jgi:hypothetical protein